MRSSAVAGETFERLAIVIGDHDTCVRGSRRTGDGPRAEAVGAAHDVGGGGGGGGTATKEADRSGKRISVRVSDEIYDQIAKLAKHERRSLAGMIKILLEDALAGKHPEGSK